MPIVCIKLCPGTEVDLEEPLDVGAAMGKLSVTVAESDERGCPYTVITGCGTTEDWIKESVVMPHRQLASCPTCCHSDHGCDRSA